jgi:hypothetical protein
MVHAIKEVQKTAHSPIGRNPEPTDVDQLCAISPGQPDEGLDALAREIIAGGIKQHGGIRKS